MLLLALACTKTIEFPQNLWEVDDTGVNEFINDSSIHQECELATDLQSIGFITAGLTGRAYYGIFQPSTGIGEAHPLPLVETDLKQPGDAYELTLLGGVAESAIWDSTQFRCTELQGLSFMIWTYDRFDTPVDCVRWGANHNAATLPANIDDPTNPAAQCRSVGVDPFIQ